MVFLLILSLLFVQTPAPSVSVDENAQQSIDRAITTLGGPKYLGVQTAIGKGFFTSFKDGMSQLPARFLDYIQYPDHERTEFIGGGIRTIQTNTGDTGWIYDGGPKKISDQTKEQVDEFKRSIHTSLEYLLRGYWKQDGGKITYVGRREAGLAKRNETIRLTLPDGYAIEYEFGR